MTPEARAELPIVGGRPHRPMPKQSVVLEQLRYDPISGCFTRRKTTSSNAKAGSPAAIAPNSRGYLQIKINGIAYQAHRLAWLYMTGEDPSKAIDHINGVKTDNRWTNLRLATQSQNAANSAKRYKSKSGLKGVDWNPLLKKWRARIMEGGRQVTIGNYETKEVAHAAYLAKEKEIFGEYTRSSP